MPIADNSRRLADADIDRAQAISIANIAIERGLVLKKSGRELVGACAHCGGHDRFAINITANVFNCRGCGGKGRGAISFVRWLDGCGFRDAVEVLVGERDGRPINSPNLGNLPAKNSGDHDRRQHDKARWLWSQRQPITGTIAEVYLRQARKIICPLPPTLGFLPSRRPDHHPAMIAAFGFCDEVEPGVLAAPRDVQAVHLTLLKPDGSGKAEVEPNKIMIGSPGCLPIVLAPPNDLLGLAICEGVEDALTAHDATGLGAWAAGSAGRMTTLAEAIPGYIEALTIYAHGDKAGQHGARALAAALRSRDIEITMEGI